jgi:hypothetical protein
VEAKKTTKQAKRTGREESTGAENCGCREKQ